jgi:hypothetical protein
VLFITSAVAILIGEEEYQSENKKSARFHVCQIKGYISTSAASGPIILCHHNVTPSHQIVEECHYMTLRKRGKIAKLV